MLGVLLVIFTLQTCEVLPETGSMQYRMDLYTVEYFSVAGSAGGCPGAWNWQIAVATTVMYGTSRAFDILGSYFIELPLVIDASSYSGRPTHEGWGPWQRTAVDSETTRGPWIPVETTASARHVERHVGRHGTRPNPILC